MHLILHPMKKRLTAILVFVILALHAGYSGDPADPSQPNIIFIMTDDHANRAMSCYGSDLIRTPNMDRIAREGMRFDNSFVTNSICAPSRAVMLTGKYSHMNGLRDNRDEFDGSQQTFVKLLRAAGYFTAIVGKWHLKTQPTGFDYWNVLIDQGEYYNPRLIEQGDTTRVQGYTTDVITDIALKTIDNRDPNQPFCLLLHHKAPHRNWMPDAKHLSLFEDQDIPLPPTFWDDYATRSTAASTQDMRVADMYLSFDMKLMPGDFEKETGTGGNGRFNPVPNWLATYNALTPDQRAAWDAHYDRIRQDFREKKPEGRALAEWKYQQYMKDYLRCVVSVDENIGRVLDYLDQHGLTENTIIVYTSDQGFYLGEHGWYDKRFMYEPSFRMPLLIRYPKRVKAGQVSKDLALNLDFAPTFLDYAGVPVPADMQGKSLRPLLEQKHKSGWRKSIYYQYYEYPHGWHKVKRHYGIRTGRYKLIHFYNDIDAWELYDLKKDPDELVNLADNPKDQRTVGKLKAELGKLRVEFKVPEDN